MFFDSPLERDVFKPYPNYINIPISYFTIEDFGVFILHKNTGILYIHQSSVNQIVLDKKHDYDPKYFLNFEESTTGNIEFFFHGSIKVGLYISIHLVCLLLRHDNSLFKTGLMQFYFKNMGSLFYCIENLVNHDDSNPNIEPSHHSEFTVFNSPSKTTNNVAIKTVGKFFFFFIY